MAALCLIVMLEWVLCVGHLHEKCIIKPEIWVSSE